MSRTTKVLSALFLAIFIALAAHLYWLSSLNGPETYPPDDYLDTEPNKTALIVVAHDDDAIGCAGTVSELTRKGWQVHFITFYGNYRKEDNPTRKAEATEAARIQQLASLHLIDLVIQRTDTVKEPWMPIPYARIPDYMKVDSIRHVVDSMTSVYQPSVIFTLDNQIGGYGHPEHVCVSQCVVDVSGIHAADSAFSVKRIYQAVFPKTLNERVLHNNPAFVAAQRVWGKGSPDPDVEVNIFGSAGTKKAVMQAYESQHRNIRKVWPYYQLYPAWLYFKIFDKEYFHVLKVGIQP